MKCFAAPVMRCFVASVAAPAQAAPEGSGWSALALPACPEVACSGEGLGKLALEMHRETLRKSAWGSSVGPWAWAELSEALAASSLLWAALLRLNSP